MLISSFVKRDLPRKVTTAISSKLIHVGSFIVLFLRKLGQKSKSIGLR